MRKLLIVIFIFFPILLIGCSENLLYAEVNRDSENVGGSISFDYNKDLGIITIGGENEQIQYYKEDIAKGWEESGNRVGIKFTAPAKVKEYETGTLSYQGKTISSGDFYREVNGQKIGEAVVYPLIKDVDKEIEIKITWQDGIEEQTYKVKIAKGTVLMQQKNLDESV